MRLVYVAGAFRGRSHWDIHQNVIAAEAAALEVAKAGAMPVCPHKNSENFHGLLTEDFWVEGTLELLRRCDAVYLFDYRHAVSSAGTRGELKEAERLKLPVFKDIARLREWVK